MSDSTKKKTIAYWVLTILVLLGEAASGVDNLANGEQPVEVVLALGYPTYILVILGLFKLAGVVAILLPGTPRIKEWAYAGFAFVFIGGAASHLLNGGGPAEIAPPLVVLAVLLASYALRPADRRL